MANLQTFINTWNGKTLDFDGAFGAQCVDLAKKWNQELGYSPRYGNGCDWINNAGNDYTRINYSSGLVPREGDIVSWSGNSPANVPYGHVAIATGVGNTSSFQTFDQNWGGAYCKLNTHSYQSVQGWIRPKNYGGGETMISDTDNEFGRWSKTFQEIRGRLPTRAEFRASGVGQTWLKALEILEDDPEADNALHAQEVGQAAISGSWEGQITSLTNQVTTLNTHITDLETNNKNLTDQIDVLNTEVASLKKQLADQVIIAPQPSQPLQDYDLGQLFAAIWAKITRSVK